MAVEVLLYVSPFLLLFADWTFNRIYINMSVLVLYPFLCYFCSVAYLQIIQAEVRVPFTVKEFAIFDTRPVWLAFALPALVSLMVYWATRAKFLFLQEGDLLASDERLW